MMCNKCRIKKVEWTTTIKLDYKPNVYVGFCNSCFNEGSKNQPLIISGV